MHTYEITTQFDTFTDDELSTRFITAALDTVFEDNIAGIYNFLVLQNTQNNRFIQTTFSDGAWTVEYSPKETYLYRAAFTDDQDVYLLFQQFYLKDEIIYDHFERVFF